MDANGTRFSLLTESTDWPKLTNAVFSTAELILDEDIFRFPSPRSGETVKLDARRGAAADKHGNIYFINSSHDGVNVQSSGTGNVTSFWRAGDPVAPEFQARPGSFEPAQPSLKPAPTVLRGLAVTNDHYLVAGVVQPPGLLVFDLMADDPPVQYLWPSAVPGFEPYDIARRGEGGVWILDRRNHRIWVIDRHFQAIPTEQRAITLQPHRVDDFQPVDGSYQREVPLQVFPAGLEIDPNDDPIAIEEYLDGTVLLLDSRLQGDDYRVNRYRWRTRLEPIGLRPDLEPTTANVPRATPHDIAFVAETNRVYLACSDGNQSYAWTLKEEKDGKLTPVTEHEFLPMRLFGGRGIIRIGVEVFYDFGDSWVPLVQQPRRRYKSSAVAMSRLMDSRQPDCVWHRLMVDACIPAGTRVVVKSRASNDPKPDDEWVTEPSLYLRGNGSELPFVTERRGPESGTWELLFQSARGRYLQLRLEFSGDGSRSPRLRAARSYYPRFSYLDRYLPAVYREDLVSASFLERFLANLEGTQTAIEDRIAAVQMLFDVRSIPADGLEWLASWFGLALDPALDDSRRRLLLSHAMQFFQFRGTARGLQMALRLSLDRCPDESLFASEEDSQIRIIEKFRTRRTPAVVFGDPRELVGPRFVKPDERWTPKLGGGELNRRYGGQFPLLAPEEVDKARTWREFSLDVLGFLPGAATRDRRCWAKFLATEYHTADAFNRQYRTRFARFDDIPLPDDEPLFGKGLEDWTRFVTDFAPAVHGSARKLWQDFLTRRYGTVQDLNRAHGTRWTSMSLVALFDELPRDGAPLLDWYHFEGVVLLVRRDAHRFTVLVPLDSKEALSSPDFQQRMEVARKIIDLEKPSHTVYELGFYWALFRVGSARLGRDTTIDVGSRAPQLMPPMILGQGYLSQSHLAVPEQRRTV